jgi:hypothetical protein
MACLRNGNVYRNAWPNNGRDLGLDEREGVEGKTLRCGIWIDEPKLFLVGLLSLLKHVLDMFHIIAALPWWVDAIIFESTQSRL